jgi:putative NADH-flavin reductase
MNIIIFGASGGTGRELVKQALEQGHAVTAFVRDKSKISYAHPQLNLRVGDVLESQAVHNAMPGHEAVIVALGAPARRAGTLRSAGTANIIHAMKAHGIKRLVCQSSLGFGDSIGVLKQTSLVFRRVIVPLLLRDTFEDHAVQEALIKQSGLNWTVVRPGNMTAGPLTGRYHHGFSSERKGLYVKISRADVAHFMLRQLGLAEYLHRTPGISY